jgi:hypothetical protein
MEKLENILKVHRNDKYVDKWTIVVKTEEGIETLCCSDAPDHPQGVFSMINGYYTSSEDEEKNWEDLPQTLQKFITNYLTNE